MLSILRLTIVLALGSSVCLTGCSKDEDDVTVDPNIEITNSLDGEWGIESYTEDGVEYIGADITSSDWVFDKEGPTEGEVEATTIFSDGSTEREIMEFSVRNEGKEIRLEDADLDIEIDGDKLSMEGTMEGYRIIIKAERR